MRSGLKDICEPYYLADERLGRFLWVWRWEAVWCRMPPGGAGPASKVRFAVNAGDAQARGKFLHGVRDSLDEWRSGFVR